MSGFVPRGSVPFLNWLDEQAKALFPEKFKWAWSEVSPREVGEAMLRWAMERTRLDSQIAEANRRMAAVGDETVSAAWHHEFSDARSCVDWNAYDPRTPEHYPLNPGLSREEFEGAKAVQGDSMPGESASLLLRQLREEMTLQMARDLSPKAELDRIRDFVRCDLEGERDSTRAELRMSAFEARRQDLYSGAVLAVSPRNDGLCDDVAPHFWGCDAALQTAALGEREGSPVWIPGGELVAKVSPTVAAETKCRNILIEQMKASPDGAPCCDDDLRKQMQGLCPGLGSNAYKRAKKDAIGATGAKGWSAPGPISARNSVR